jgi:hypothetical protein
LHQLKCKALKCPLPASAPRQNRRRRADQQQCGGCDQRVARAGNERSGGAADQGAESSDAMGRGFDLLDGLRAVLYRVNREESHELGNVN